MRNFRISPYSFQSTYVAPPLEFIQQQMDKQQNTYDRNIAMFNEAYGKLGETPYIDAKAREEVLANLDKRFKDVSSKYKGDFSAATSDILGLISSERANPYWNANAKQVAEAQRQKALQDRFGINALVGRDVTKMSLRDAEGKWVKPEDIEASVYNKEDYVQQFGKNNQAIVQQVRDSGIMQGDRPGLLKRVTTLGATAKEVNSEYNPNSPKSEQHAIEAISSTPGLAKYLTEAYGNPNSPEALQFVKQMNYDYAIGNFIKGQKVDDINDPGYITPYQRSKMSGSGTTPPPGMQQPHSFEVRYDLGKNEEYSKVSNLLEDLNKNSVGEGTVLANKGTTPPDSKVNPGLGIVGNFGTGVKSGRQVNAELETLKKQYPGDWKDAQTLKTVGDKEWSRPAGEIDKQRKFLESVQNKILYSRKENLLIDKYMPSQYRVNDLWATINDTPGQGITLQELNADGSIAGEVRSTEFSMNEDGIPIPLKNANVSINHRLGRLEVTSDKGVRYAVPGDKLPATLKASLEMGKEVADAMYGGQQIITPQITTGLGGKKSYFAEPVYMRDSYGNPVFTGQYQSPVIRRNEDKEYEVIWATQDQNGKLQYVRDAQGRLVKEPYTPEFFTSRNNIEFNKTFAKPTSKNEPQNIIPD